MTRTCRSRYLGCVPYGEAMALQAACARRLREAREGEAAGPAAAATEQLLLLEHPPVVTLGRNARDTDLLLGADALRQRGIAVERCDRGGQVTYHGPGQLVGYPILDLTPDRRDVARYLRDLEEVLIRTLGRFGIRAERRDGLTGVWVGAGKIASIGVHLSRWVTTHGFALNVTTDTTPFSLIVPCGMRALSVTSMLRLLGRPVPVTEVASVCVREFSAVFDRRMIEAGDDAGPAEELGEAC